MLKKLLVALSASAIMSTTAMAVDKNIDVAVYSKEGGNSWMIGKIMQGAFDNAGYNTTWNNAPNCSALEKRLAQNFNNKATIFLYSDLSRAAHSKTGCNFDPREGFVTALYARNNVMCSRAGEANDVKSLLASREEFTVASSNTMPEKIFTELSTSTGKNFKQVPYRSSGSALRGLVAGDTDFLYTGLTAKVANNEKVDCWAVTGPEEMNGYTPMAEMFPGYSMANLTATYYVFGAHLSDEQKQAITEDARALTETSKEWGKFIRESFMVPANKLTTFTAEDSLAGQAAWQ